MALDAAGLAAPLTALEKTGVSLFPPRYAAFISLAWQPGFRGSDEAGSRAFLVDAISTLNDGDPFSLSGAILCHHVLPGQYQTANPAFDKIVETLIGQDFLYSDGQIASTDLDQDDFTFTA